MPSLEAKTRNPPRGAQKQAHQDECVRLRRSGLSYRKIGDEVGLSHVRARELCEEAFSEIAERVRDNATALLGEELERVDGVIRSAHAMMLSSGSTEAAKLRAMEVIRRCADTKVRWLGLAAPEHLILDDQRSWADAISAEVAAMSSDELDRELSALGYAQMADDRLLTRSADAEAA